MLRSSVPSGAESSAGLPGLQKARREVETRDGDQQERNMREGQYRCAMEVCR